MQPWQHFSGLPLSGQSSDSSLGQTVMQSHLDLSGGQTKTRFLLMFWAPLLLECAGLPLRLREQLLGKARKRK
jgi:hypothetical protein